MNGKLKIGLLMGIILLPFFFITACTKYNNETSIIPLPLEMTRQNGSFQINPQTQIIIDYNDARVKDIAGYFRRQLNHASGFNLQISELSSWEDRKNIILFTDKKADASLSDEAYTLSADEGQTILKGRPPGLFYAVQTLFQLLPPEIYALQPKADIDWRIPAVKIKDKPRFKWRGMHLDVSRHFFSVSFIKKYLDYIAMHKMNHFHWHLTDDQGWRIEIKKYPKLTAVGAWRKGTTIAELNKPNVLDGIRYGGFYTQDEIREVVEYARERFITVIPEIEMPGHCQAALAAYPQLSCSGGPFEVKTNWGINEDLYCAGNDSVFTFLKNVFTEVIDLFPSEYIHIGGDEAPKIRWKACPKCQARIKKEHLKDEEELQSYFINRIAKFINSKGKKVIGWDEILQKGLTPDAAIMSWRGDEGGITAANNGHYAVMSPTPYCYFDLYQGNPQDEPRAMEGVVTLEKTYSYNVIPSALSNEKQKYILGVQGNLWTEFIKTPRQAEYMLFPRMCALSEVAWSVEEKRNLQEFLTRLEKQFDRFDLMNINYRWPRMEGVKKTNVFIDNFKVNLKSKRKNVEIRYTTDGSLPSGNSFLYEKPFIINETTKIRVTEFASTGKHGPVYEINNIKQAPLKALTPQKREKGLKVQYFALQTPIDSTLQLYNFQAADNTISEKFIFPFADNKLPDYFGLIFSGYIKIPQTDVYTFSVQSNDGSRLFIDGQQVVENDGWHGPFEKAGEIALQQGRHKIKLLYFQSGGRKSLKVYLKQGNGPKEEIPEDILYH
jgi:hexosaminidase